MLDARASTCDERLDMDLDSAAFERAADHARSYIVSGHLGCAVLAVADRERVLAVRSFGEGAEEDPSLQDRIYALASITKAIVATAVARLVDEGRLDYRDQLVKHIPELGTAPWREQITVGDVFTHSTGLPQMDWTSYCDLDLAGMARLERAFEGEPLYPPGTRMQYATLTYQLLNEIVARMLGTTMSAFIQEYVLEPCGMADTGFRPVDPGRAMTVVDHPRDTAEKMERFAAVELSGGGLWSSVSDLIGLAQAVLTPDRLLSAEGYRRLTTPQPRLPLLGGEALSHRTWGWVKEEQAAFPQMPASGFYHGGATGTLLWLDPDRGLIFVFLTNRWASGNDHAFATLACLYE